MTNIKIYVQSGGRCLFLLIAGGNNVCTVADLYDMEMCCH